MKYNFVTYLQDPWSKEHKVFKFKSLEVAYAWFNKMTNIKTGRTTNKRKITFNSQGLVTARDGAVIGMWRTC
ncbi:hypothetical protein EBY67_04930 [bacterium]|nr:hypothetical protein [Verrucomicrobiota bacterium]NDH86380.1 hypothetical protein [bacterium]